jgi:hypothetical protein
MTGKDSKTSYTDYSVTEFLECKIDKDNIHCVPGGMCQTSGGCSLC